MSIRPFPGFESLETHHCVTGSMLHIYRSIGIGLSEELLLGLGSGVGFIYWHQKGMEPFIGGRANVGRPGEAGLEKTASKRLGVHCESFYTTSPRKAETALVALLESAQPVMLQVDMGYLPYFDFGGEEYHFGYHVIVVAGFDPKTRDVLVADRDSGFHQVTWEALSNARSSAHKPFPPRNRWYSFDFSRYHSPAAVDVRLSLQEVVHGMLEPPISNLGVKGIQKAAVRMLSWPQEMALEVLRRTCFNTYIFIDAAGGSGGGIFRYMYGRYLNEVAIILGNPDLVKVGERFMSIGDRWQVVAENFRRGYDLEDPAVIIPETSQLLLEIASWEEEAWEQLNLLIT